MQRFSWRADPVVAPFDDAAPLVVFDGDCVLCSGAARQLNLCIVRPPEGRSDGLDG
jgi:hypothetical protein